jgi:hypothetical protein
MIGRINGAQQPGLYAVVDDEITNYTESREAIAQQPMLAAVF